MKKKIAIILSVLSFAVCGCGSVDGSKEEASWEGTYKYSYSVDNELGGVPTSYNYTVVIDEKDEQLNISYEKRQVIGDFVGIDIEEAIIQNTGTHLITNEAKGGKNVNAMEIELLDDGNIKVRMAVDEASLGESEFVTLERTDE